MPTFLFFGFYNYHSKVVHTSRLPGRCTGPGTVMFDVVHIDTRTWLEDTSIGHQWIALDDLDQCEIGRWIASRVLNLVAMLPE